MNTGCFAVDFEVGKWFTVEDRREIAGALLLPVMLVLGMVPVFL